MKVIRYIIIVSVVFAIISMVFWFRAGYKIGYEEGLHKGYKMAAEHYVLIEKVKLKKLKAEMTELKTSKE